jgi:hypothetical protein
VIVDETRICGHCQRPMRGYASAGTDWLCHPDDGIDCYRLVTLYGHSTPCDRLQAEKAHYEAPNPNFIFRGGMGAL